MNFTDLEEYFLVYFKLLDGLTFSLERTKIVSELSMNSNITADYLTEKYDLEKIYVFSKNEVESYKNIVPVEINSSLSKVLSLVKCDFVLSLAGSFNFHPIYETVHAILKCLNVGGRFMFAIYPSIYDENGNDVLKSLSLISEQYVAEKLNRWQSVIVNSMENVFIKVSADEFMQEISYDEIKAIYKSDSFFPYLFDSEKKYTDFFKPLDSVTTKKYSAAWNFISGMKN